MPNRARRELLVTTWTINLRYISFTTVIPSYGSIDRGCKPDVKSLFVMLDVNGMLDVNVMLDVAG